MPCVTFLSDLSWHFLITPVHPQPQQLLFQSLAHLIQQALLVWPAVSKSASV